MKTHRFAWTIYRLRVWTGLAGALLIALTELWMGLHFGTDAAVTGQQQPPKAAAELCDLIR